MNRRFLLIVPVVLMFVGVEVSRCDERRVCDSVVLPRTQLDGILLRLEQVEQENRRLSQGYDDLKRLPATHASYVEGADVEAVSIQQGCGAYGCDGCGCSCCQPHGWYVGAEALFIRPQWRETLALEVIEGDNETLIPFDFDFEIAGRVTLGYTTCNGLGVRARYMRFDHGSSFSFTADDGSEAELQAFDSPDIDLFARIRAEPGETLTASYDLEFDVLDAEVTQHFQGQCALLVAGCGLRYARINHHTFGEVREEGDVEETMDHTNGFEGIGPMLSLEVWRPVGLCHGLSLYCNTRGSILFGDSDQHLVEFNPQFSELSVDRRSEQGVMTILEIGLGVEWTRELPRYCSALFLRGGYEGQYWLDAGGPDYPTNNMGLQGFIINAGITR